MSSLLIVESPAKCSKIQGFLGPGWKVIATMGHIRSLEEDLGAVGVDRDFEPRYAFLKEKSKAIQQIKTLAKGAMVYLASDDDREGEAISYSVAVLLGLPIDTTPRIVFHEITKEAITTALRNPQRINMDRANAQQARAILDMLVGFSISPLLWKFVGAGLSAGRCQTPALRLVADREHDIAEFVSETTWAVQGVWTTGQSTFEAHLTDQLEDRESATNYLENISDDAGGLIKSAITKPTTMSPPKPLITSTLQQEASALYNSQPKNTMRIAQKLYEAGHITYMRTDSIALSEEAVSSAQAFIRTNYGEAFIGVKAPPPKKSKKGEVEPQAAHEAIRPTHIDTMLDLPTTEDWSAIDRKIYKLIWSRTIQSVMAPCKGEDRIVDFVATGDPNEMIWRAKWERITFLGWKRVGQVIANLDEDEGTEGDGAQGSWTIGQSLQVGSQIKWKSLSAVPKDTKSPPRYTEATLVRELENKGIGRPSTFASLISTIIDKQYVEKRDTPPAEQTIIQLHIKSLKQWPPTEVEITKKIGAEKQKLAPTALGKSVLEFCLREFNELFAYGFTKQMEERLDRIADGKEVWKGICRDTWESFKEPYTALKAQKGTQVQSAKQILFAEGVKAVQSKKGPILLIEGDSKDIPAVFYGWPEGVSFSEITEEVALAFVAQKKKEKEVQTLGLFEGEPMVCQSGPFGKYVVCGSVNIPWKENDTAETVRERILEKRASVLHEVGGFEFRRGPYGIYMFKKGTVGKARQFVSIPSGIDPKALTGEAAIKLYQTGLQLKAKAKAYGNKK